MARYKRFVRRALSVVGLTTLVGCGHPVLDLTLLMLPMQLGRLEVTATLLSPMDASVPMPPRISTATYYKIAGNQYSTTDPMVPPMGGSMDLGKPLMDMNSPSTDMSNQPTDMSSVGDMGGTTETADLGNTATWSDKAEFIFDMPAGLYGNLNVQVDFWLYKDDKNAAVIGDCQTVMLNGNKTYPLTLRAAAPRVTCPTPGMPMM